MVILKVLVLEVLTTPCSGYPPNGPLTMTTDMARYIGLYQTYIKILRGNFFRAGYKKS
jgi:hypothetical protein